MSRIRHVHPNAMVKHLWANQSQDHARSGNGNLSFKGRVLYSWGTAIANFIPAADGTLVALITSRRYSVSTSAQTPRESDVPGLAFVVPNLCLPNQNVAGDHTCNMQHFLELYENEVAKAKRALNPPCWIGMFEARIYSPPRHLDNLRRYAATFALQPPELPDWEADRAFILARLERIANDPRRVERAAKREAAHKRELEIDRAHGAESLAAWLRGAGPAFTLPRAVRSTPGGGVYLRVRGEAVETSQGVSVPLGAGKKLFALCAWQHRVGAPCEPALAVQVGDFRLTRIDAYGNAWVGCHYLEWDEMVRCAGVAGI